jgi:hypothetical protein
MNNELVRIWKETIVAHIEAFLRETTKNLSQDSWLCDLYSKWVIPKHIKWINHLQHHNQIEEPSNM